MSSRACLAHGFGDRVGVLEAGLRSPAAAAAGAQSGLRGGLADSVLARALVRAVVVEVCQLQPRVRHARPPAGTPPHALAAAQQRITKSR